jgi:phenylalanyl-tRNA synthetase beta chain
MFERYCQPGGGIQQVWVAYEDNDKVPTGCWYPQFKPVSFEVDPNLLKKRVLGHTDMTTVEVQAYLEKMSLTSSVTGENLLVQVPPWRHDIFHVCDIVEDFAISYGYSNLIPSVSHLPTFGRKNAQNSMADSLRLTLSQMGLTEALNFVLVGGETEHLSDISQVTLANSRSLDFQSVRTSLIPGLIKTFASNNHRRKPQKLFEVGDVCRVVDGVPLNFRKLAVCILDNWTQDMQSSMQQIQEVLDTLMEKLGVLSQVAINQQELQGAQNVKPKKVNGTASKKSFRVFDGEHPWFLPRCRGDVMMGNQCIGHIGTLSPDFTAQFRVTLPVLCLELELTAFLS